MKANEKDDWMKQVVAELKKIRIEKKLTCDAVKTKTGIHISRIEENAPHVTVSTLRKLLAFYGTNEVEFFGKTKL